MIKLYNTATRKKEEFKPIKNKTVGLYTCGPTVYDYPHLGNYRAYLFTDILKRTLIYSGYHVQHVMNITDVDDKTIRTSQKVHKTLEEFTSFYEQGFFEDLAQLNIQKADKYPRATDHVKEMVKMIEVLLKKGIAYKGEDGSIYFNIKKFATYGRLAHIKLAQLKEGASGRVKNDEYTKENVQDFALWKAWDETDGDVKWDYFGGGRPGWHIECSAMSMKYLGNHFDIHTGGIDLIFPHHQNEIAQSEGVTGKPFVNYWLHNGWLLVDGQKMSKSLGNFITFRDILAKGFDPIAYRFFCLNAHYRQATNFTWDALDAASQGLEGLRRDTAAIKTKGMTAEKSEESTVIVDLIDAAKEKFETAMSDDLNASQALGVLFSLIKRINKEKNLSGKDYKNIYKTILNFDAVLGLKLDEEMVEKKQEIPSEVLVLLEKRNSARANKDWQQSDVLRTEIEKLGYTVEDSKEGSKLVPLL